MERVLTAFKERKEFKSEKPWSITPQYFPNDVKAPPHYAETIEILLCRDMSGEVYIGGRQYELNDKQVFYIPPGFVHSMNYKKSAGRVLVVKLNISYLSKYLNIENVLGNIGANLLTLPVKIHQYERVEAIAEALNRAENILDAVLQITVLFSVLVSSQQNTSGLLFKPANNTNNSFLHRVTRWTEQHYLEKISVAEISAMMGYSKCYFCNKFKALTGTTYLNYINNLRIYHACDLLKEDFSVERTAELCNFIDTSYFIQVFKKTVGVTPKQYSIKNID